MSVDGSNRRTAFEIMQGYTIASAAPLVLWGALLSVAAPLLVALAYASGRTDFFTGATSPNAAFMILAIPVGIAGTILLIAGCWRAARNNDYVAAATYLRVAAERDATAARRRDSATEPRA